MKAKVTTFMLLLHLVMPPIVKRKCVYLSQRCWLYHELLSQRGTPSLADIYTHQHWKAAEFVLLCIPWDNNWSCYKGWEIYL